MPTINPKDLLVEGDNGVIWNRVSHCEDFGDDLNGFLKAVDYGERKYTSIDAYVQIRKATELFGPMGYGWGVRNIKNIATIPITKQTRRGPVSGDELLFSGEFWYLHAGKVAVIEVMEDIFLDASGDSLKKVVTGMITKALSYLGFNYDVFRGRFNDVKTFDSPASEEEKAVLSNLLKKVKPEAAAKIASYHAKRGYLRPEVLADIKKIQDALAAKEAASGNTGVSSADAVREDAGGEDAAGSADSGD